jgi:hypothetical protein
MRITNEVQSTSIVFTSLKFWIAEFVRIPTSQETIAKSAVFRCLTTSATSPYPIFKLCRSTSSSWRALGEHAFCTHSIKIEGIRQTKDPNNRSLLCEVELPCRSFSTTKPNKKNFLALTAVESSMLGRKNTYHTYSIARNSAEIYSAEIYSAEIYSAEIFVN